MQHGGKPMLTTTDNAVIRAAIVRYLANEGVDRDASHELYHDDAILEFPQSGERFVGRETIREWRERYPSSTRFRLRRLVGSGSTWTAEILISYDGGPWMFGVGIYTLRGDRVAREFVYVMDGFPAAEWRAQWATRFDPLASIPAAEWREGVPFGLDAEVQR
jgi:SnoaL-like domain